MDGRVAVIADIHANVWALDAVLADIDRRTITTVVNLGDSLAGLLAPAETTERLLARGFLTVAGNNDHDILAPAPTAGSNAAFARAPRRPAPRLAPLVAADGHVGTGSFPLPWHARVE